LCSGLDSLGFVDESSLMKNTKFIRANSQRTQIKTYRLSIRSTSFLTDPPASAGCSGTWGARVDSLGGYITPLRVHHSRFQWPFYHPPRPRRSDPGRTAATPQRISSVATTCTQNTLTRQSNRPYENNQINSPGRQRFALHR
jgi:hypothetical protein